ncbi:hypothetical protein DH2020_045451 [Rehmannia glutinosa]|uniref:Uncharacterized protein n=1 Tax=Rehmannia glutinosa TaxID=99300 RepID=A0ABR0UFU1_REHGL
MWAFRTGRLSKSLVAVALAVEAELAEEAMEQQQDDGGGVAVAVAARPNKCKAALPLKRDRGNGNGNPLDGQDLTMKITLSYLLVDRNQMPTRSKRFLEIQKLRGNKQEFDLKQQYGCSSKQQAQSLWKRLKPIFALKLIQSKFAQSRPVKLLKLLFLLKAIEEFKKGKVEYRADKTGIVHIPFGKADFSEEDLVINFLAAVKSVEINKPSEAKGVYWRSAHLCSSMGPSIWLNIRDMLDYKLP